MTEGVAGPVAAVLAPLADIVVFNGVAIDLRARTVTHRERTVKIWDDGVKFVAALARVMPAMLIFSTLEKRIYGRAIMDGQVRIRLLADQLNPVLRGARLEIKTVPKQGNTLFDLGSD